MMNFRIKSVRNYYPHLLLIAALLAVNIAIALLRPPQVIFVPTAEPQKQEQAVNYDGEGNEIPQQAVSLLVKSQFVKMTKEEDATINKYFYFRKAYDNPESLEYTLQVEKDGCLVWDGERFVGYLPFGDGKTMCKLDKLIFRDND